MAKKRGNGEGSISKRKDGIWMGRVTVGLNENGTPRQTFYGKTRQEVADKVAKAVNEINTGTYVEPSQLTLGTWLDIWLQEYIKQSVKLSTFVSYDLFIRQHIKPIIGHIPLKDLRTDRLQKFYNDKHESGRLDGKGGLNPKTIKNIHNMLHEALDQAYKNGLVVKNVSDAVILPKIKKKEMRVLTPQEQQRLLTIARQDRLGMGIILDLSTGLRLGELLGLQWKDINLNTGVITVRQTINRLKVFDEDSDNKTAIVIGEPKTKNSQRQIPLQDVVLEQLKAYKGIQEQEKFDMGGVYEDNGFVFSSQFGRPIEPRTFQDTFYRLVKQAGIADANFHCLRHTFATRALEAGIPAKTVSEILGHANISTTLDLYSHVSLDLKKQSMEKLSDLFTT